MQTKLFVGNLNYQVSEEALKEIFAKCGNIQTLEIVRDRYSGQSKGFAFVTMATPEEAQKALELNGTEFMGRNLNVSEARPPKQRDDNRRGGGGGGFRGGYGGGGGGGGGRGGRGGWDR
ncbi:MAG: RNA-binding protein [Candidatus Omnitrophica bacterium]|nr:RNA-binding protein [Candidatus Omnitrophota bacterium]MDD5670852.1 RNA-binding protein [Candidatus Omnitrophota bacterium]